MKRMSTFRKCQCGNEFVGSYTCKVLCPQCTEKKKKEQRKQWAKENPEPSRAIKRRWKNKKRKELRAYERKRRYLKELQRVATFAETVLNIQEKVQHEQHRNDGNA